MDVEDHTASSEGQPQGAGMPIAIVFECQALARYALVADLT
jgi:hypothetical protein